MPKQQSMNTPMARAFFRHYEHKRQVMKRFLPPDAASQHVGAGRAFSSDFSPEFA